MWVYKVDPYMHYHKPDVSRYYYSLSNERSQNDGITKHFDYDALITGSSVTENFKTSEMDDVFGCNSIKVSYSGGSYKEINDNLKNALKNNSDLKTVVRSLDMTYFFDDKDKMRDDLGEYPTYLYDSNPLNDVQYIWNRDVIWNRVYAMTEKSHQEDFIPGITSFDDYAQWQDSASFGLKSVYANEIEDVTKGEPVHLSDSEKETIAENISQNVTDLARENPDVTFYYFFPPYSVFWWKDLVESGSIYKQLEAEEYIIEMILQCENIRLFSFNNRTDIICDINNYKDPLHYGAWINSLILRWMHDGEYELKEDNYKKYLEKELENYLNFQYSELNNQPDYESDLYAAALLNPEATGIEPVNILDADEDDLHLKNASIVDDQYEGTKGIDCVGSLQRDVEAEMSVFDYFVNVDYIGASIDVKDADKYRYITFCGKKIQNNGQPLVYVVDENGNKAGEVSCNYYDIDNEWHQYVIDLTEVTGKTQIIFNGGYIDNSGSPESEYIFSNIILY